MNDIALQSLQQWLHAELTKTQRQSVEMKLVGPSGLAIRVDGRNCLTSISVWPNGCCDVDYLIVSTEKCEFNHYEFQSKHEAATVVIKEIRAAIERASPPEPRTHGAE